MKHSFTIFLTIIISLYSSSSFSLTKISCNFSPGQSCELKLADKDLYEDGFQDNLVVLSQDETISSFKETAQCNVDSRYDLEIRNVTSHPPQPKSDALEVERIDFENRKLYVTPEFEIKVVKYVPKIFTRKKIKKKNRGTLIFTESTISFSNISFTKTVNGKGISCKISQI